MRPQALNLAQRVVVVIALAGVLYTVGSYVVARIVDEAGWFGYAPLSRAITPAGPSLVATLVWIVIVAVWAAASVWLLGLRYDPPGGSSD